MPYDPTIALRAVQPQIDFGGAVQNAMAFRNAQQVNQLNQLKLAQEQQAAIDENALRQATQGLNLSTPEGQQSYGQALLNRGNVKGYQEFQAGLATQSKAERESSKAFDEAVKSRMELSGNQLAKVTTPEEYVAWHEANHNDPILSQYFAQQGISKESARAKIDQALSTPGGFEKLLQQSKDSIVGLTKTMEMNTPKLGTYQPGDYTTASWAKFTTTKNPADLQLKPTTAASTNITVKTGEEAATALAKQMGQKVADEMSDLNTKATSAKSNIETSQLLRPLVNDPNFISGTLGDARLAVAKALGLSGAEATQTFFAGIGKQVAENVKSFGSGTAISDADRAYAEKIAGGSIELTPSAIKKIMDLNDKYSQMAIDKYNSRKKFLSQKNPTINDYYEDIAAPSVKTTGGAYNDADKEARYQAWKAQQSKK